MKKSTFFSSSALKVAALFIVMATAGAGEADAQLGGLLKKATSKLKEKVEQKIDQKIDKVTDKIVNAPEEGLEGLINGEGSEEGADDKADNSNDGFQKNDFVPGTEAFFFDDVTKEQVGEFPSMWDLLSGEEVEIATYKGEKVIKLGGWCTEIAPLMKEADYLPEEFTVEYEVLTTGINAGSNNDHLDICFYSADNDRIASMSLNPDGGQHNDEGLSYRKPDGSWGESNVPSSKIDALVKKNTWTKVGISFNKRAFKAYVNGTRIFNVPNMMKPSRMKLISVSNSDQRPYFFIKNVRIARGAVALYDKKESSNEIEKSMKETGKFVTNNILFETGKADIKAESMAEIQKVAAYMKANPSVRFEVQGHCDNQGSDKVNDPLSQKRSEAIVAELVKLGVDEFNLKAVGKGSHEPVADNKTEEGRAKNRRVEFIKR